jgi:hypothetical protein
MTNKQAAKVANISEAAMARSRAKDAAITLALARLNLRQEKPAEAPLMSFHGPHDQPVVLCFGRRLARHFGK